MVCFSDVPTLILDQAGTCIGVAAPPCSNSGLTKEVEDELKSLIEYGKYYKDSKRGAFEILQHGLQMGHGHIVRKVH
jgi:hypothetical protein